LEAVDEYYQLLDAPLVIICDNRNCSLVWHNLDLFGARHLDLFEKLKTLIDYLDEIISCESEEKT
jgi:hypothetical protein